MSIFSEMEAKWKSTVVARTECDKFTGGVIKEKYLANLDSAGRGPSGRFRCGRKVAYPVCEFVRWLEKRSIVIPEGTKCDAGKQDHKISSDGMRDTQGNKRK